MAMALTLAACEDNKMEWGTPDGHGQADLSDIPLSLTEKIANYKSIKEPKAVLPFSPQKTLLDK